MKQHKTKTVDPAIYDRPLAIHAYSLGQLAAIYGCCTATLNKRLLPVQDKIGKRRGHYYYPLQVEIILAQLGDHRLGMKGNPNGRKPAVKQANSQPATALQPNS
ncbi:MAG: hypothetical protein JWQ27_2696 [Ferruginibacter sp.]|nr:hypothetical protein [Ferruginibacter sp.]